MKKCWVFVLMAILLFGCAAKETFETVDDDMLLPAMASANQLSLTLPESATAQAIQGDDGGRLYFCDNYVLIIQTLDGGDMERTAKELCGFGTENLNVMETAVGENRRRDWVWTSAGEGGDSVGRAAVLDDGHFHYCVTVMTDAETAGTLETEWNGLFNSIHID